MCLNHILLGVPEATATMWISSCQILREHRKKDALQKKMQIRKNNAKYNQFVTVEEYITGIA